MKKEKEKRGEEREEIENNRKVFRIKVRVRKGVKGNQNDRVVTDYLKKEENYIREVIGQGNRSTKN